MIRESFAKHPVETGGILLGHILEGGLWVVIEMIPPGFRSTHQSAYFEYDLDFVNYLGTSIANQYKKPLQVLGLWHRHPGSMDYFSSTDDGTNSEFASKNPYGVISGLVNIDPSFRLTMYHLDHNDGVRPRNVAYTTVDVEIGDDLIPEKFFALRYVDEARSELHPTPTNTNTHVSQTRSVPKSPRNGSDEEVAEQATSDIEEQSSASSITIAAVTKKRKSRKWLFPAISAVLFFVGLFVGVMSAPLFESLPKKEQVEVKNVVKEVKGDKDKPVNDDNSSKAVENADATTSDNSNDSISNQSVANQEITNNDDNNGDNRH